MMLAFFLYSLSLETLVVVALSHIKPEINNQVTQCSPFEVNLVSGNFTDGRADDPVPAMISILPFGSSVYSIPIPNIEPNSTTISLSFVPLAAGTSFVASLADATGAEIGLATDIISVMPSSTDDTSCLPTVPPPQVYQLPDAISQCETFNVTYNPTVVTRPPIVRIVDPKGATYNLNQTNTDNSTAGTSFYVMNALRGTQLILAMDDQDGHSESSQLFSILGDASSSSSCISFGNFTSTPTNSKTDTKTKTISSALSAGSIIAISVGISCAVVIIAGIMIVYVFRQRRRRRAESRLYQQFFAESTPAQRQISQIQVAEQGLNSFTVPWSPSSGGRPASDAGFVKNPVYTSKYYAAGFEDDRRTSLASWSQVVPEDQIYPGNDKSTYLVTGYVDSDKSGAMVTSPRTPGRASTRSQAYSVTSLDIEQILDTAAEYQEERESTPERLPDSRSSMGHLPAVVNTPMQGTDLSSVEEPSFPVLVSPPPALLTADPVLPSPGRRGIHRLRPDVPADLSYTLSMSDSTLDGFSQQAHLSSDPRGYRISNLTNVSYVTPPSSTHLQTRARS